MVAQSTDEADYIAMSYAFCESIWLRRLSADFGMKGNTGLSIKVRADNLGAIDIASNEIVNELSKHIEVKYHFLKHQIEEGTVNCSTPLPLK